MFSLDEEEEEVLSKVCVYWIQVFLIGGGGQLVFCNLYSVLVDVLLIGQKILR